MDKILERVGKALEDITDPEKIEKMLELAVRLLEVYAKVKTL
jgi:hypothetical protein